MHCQYLLFSIILQPILERGSWWTRKKSVDFDYIYDKRFESCIAFITKLEKVHRREFVSLLFLGFVLKQTSENRYRESFKHNGA